MGVLRADGLRVLEADFARVVGSRFGDADSVRICRRVGLAAEFAGRRDLGDRLDVELLRWAGQFPIICDRDSFDCLRRGLPGLVRVVATHRRDGGGVSLCWARVVAEVPGLESPVHAGWLEPRPVDGGFGHRGPWVSLGDIAAIVGP
jgi:hypothetical protein